mgnify:CR=1 FL=1
MIGELLLELFIPLFLDSVEGILRSAGMLFMELPYKVYQNRPEIELLRGENGCSTIKFVSKLVVHRERQRGLAKAPKSDDGDEIDLLLSVMLSASLIADSGLCTSVSMDLLWLLHEPVLELFHGILHAYRLHGANQPGKRSWTVSGNVSSDAGLVVAAATSWEVKVLHPVPGAALADMLRPELEVADLGGDAAALVEGGEKVPRPLEGDGRAAPPGLAAEAVADIVDAVLDVVGHLAHLLHPVLTLLVVVDVPSSLELAEEGLHAGHLVVDVLDVVVDAGDQGVLLREEAAQLADQGLHGAARRADDELHCRQSARGPYLLILYFRRSLLPVTEPDRVIIYSLRFKIFDTVDFLVRV